MSDRTPQKGAIKHTGKLDIGDVLATPIEEPAVLVTEDGLANPLATLLAETRVRGMRCLETTHPHRPHIEYRNRFSRDDHRAAILPFDSSDAPASKSVA